MVVDLHLHLLGRDAARKGRFRSINPYAAVRRHRDDRAKRIVIRDPRYLPHIAALSDLLEIFGRIKLVRTL